MGKNTRLSFCYRLKRAGILRVQIYSLSKGYHRHLTLTSLPQGKWRQAAVDMTAARRPDGSGGPLSEGEVDGYTIECWLHGSCFDLRTGQPTAMPATVPVPVYPVKIEGDDVLVSI